MGHKGSMISSENKSKLFFIGVRKFLFDLLRLLFVRFRIRFRMGPKWFIDNEGWPKQEGYRRKTNKYIDLLYLKGVFTPSKSNNECEKIKEVLKKMI